MKPQTITVDGRAIFVTVMMPAPGELLTARERWRLVLERFEEVKGQQTDSAWFEFLAALGDVVDAFERFVVIDPGQYAIGDTDDDGARPLTKLSEFFHLVVSLQHRTNDAVLMLDQCVQHIVTLSNDPQAQFRPLTRH